MLAIRTLVVWGVHSLAVTKRYYPPCHLIIVNNTIIIPIYRSELNTSENMELHIDLEIKTQKKRRKHIYLWQII